MTTFKTSIEHTQHFIACFNCLVNIAHYYPAVGFTTTRLTLSVNPKYCCLQCFKMIVFAMVSMVDEGKLLSTAKVDMQ